MKLSGLPSLSLSLSHWIIQHMVNQPFVTDTETACRGFFLGCHVNNLMKKNTGSVSSGYLNGSSSARSACKEW